MERHPSVADLAIGRSAVRRRILGLLFADPAIRLHLRDIQRRAATTPGTASRELGVLVAAGLAEREPEGRHVFFRAATSAFAEMLRALLLAEGSITAPDREPAAPNDGPAAPNREPAAPGRPVAPNRPPARAAGRAPAARYPGRVSIDPGDFDAARQFAAEMRAEFGEGVAHVILFGRRLHAGAPAAAPLEFLVVLDGIDAYGEAIDRSSKQVVALSVDRGVVVSRVFIPAGSWQERDDPFFSAVRSSGVAL